MTKSQKNREADGSIQPGRVEWPMKYEHISQSNGEIIEKKWTRTEWQINKEQYWKKLVTTKKENSNSAKEQDQHQQTRIRNTPKNTKKTLQEHEHDRKAFRREPRITAISNRTTKRVDGNVDYKEAIMDPQCILLLIISNISLEFDTLESRCLEHQLEGVKVFWKVCNVHAFIFLSDL